MLVHTGREAELVLVEPHDHPDVAQARNDAFDVLQNAFDEREPVGSIDARIDRATRAWAVAHGWATLLLSEAFVAPPGTNTIDRVRRQMGCISVDSAT